MGFFRADEFSNEVIEKGENFFSAMAKEMFNSSSDELKDQFVKDIINDPNIKNDPAAKKSSDDFFKEVLGFEEGPFEKLDRLKKEEEEKEKSPTFSEMKVGEVFIFDERLYIRMQPLITNSGTIYNAFAVGYMTPNRTNKEFVMKRGGSYPIFFANNTKVHRANLPIIIR